MFDRLTHCLDDLATPGKYILHILWICNRVPSEPSTQIYGVLDRAVKYVDSIHVLQYLVTV